MRTRETSIAGLVLLVVAAATVFYFWQSKQPAATSDVSANVAAAESTARFVPDGWHEYRNTAYRFSLLYPQELNVKEYPEGGNALTITFQDSERKEGFQLFILPYEETQVSEVRFKKDLPSGVRTNMTDILVGGATGAAFYSTNPTLGETREIWFVHGGFLFEATTLEPLETWFDNILRTWEFL